MKNIFILMFLFAFATSVFAQSNYPKLSPATNLSNLSNLSNPDSKKSEFSVSDNLHKMNSNSTLKSLSLNKKKDANAMRPNPFSFSINPYFWAFAMGGSVSVPEYSGYFTFNESFSDAVKNLKMAAMVFGDIRYSRVSFIYDIGYVNLKNFGATAPQGLGLRSANVTMQQTIADLELGYLFPMKDGNTLLTAFIGTRMLDINEEATVIDSNGTQSKMLQYTNTWLSPLIGVNTKFIINKQWFVRAIGDIGGFGVNEQMTWQLAGYGGYNFSPNFNTTLGIKWVGFNFYKPNYKLSINDYGIVLSVGYKYN